MERSATAVSRKGTARLRFSVFVRTVVVVQCLVSRFQYVTTTWEMGRTSFVCSSAAVMRPLSSFVGLGQVSYVTPPTSPAGVDCSVVARVFMPVLAFATPASCRPTPSFLPSFGAPFIDCCSRATDASCSHTQPPLVARSLAPPTLPCLSVYLSLKAAMLRPATTTERAVASVLNDVSAAIHGAEQDLIINERQARTLLSRIRRSARLPE